MVNFNASIFYFYFFFSFFFFTSFQIWYSSFCGGKIIRCLTVQNRNKYRRQGGERSRGKGGVYSSNLNRSLSCLRCTTIPYFVDVD